MHIQGEGQEAMERKGHFFTRYTSDEPNDASNKVLGGLTPRVNSQDQIVQSWNCCYLSFRVASIDENKIQPMKEITLTQTQTTCPNLIALRAGKNGARPAEVGALAPMFENSATELKQKQKLLKCKSTRKIPTFNVRT